MEGSVGETMRATELKVLVEYIDENYGPGQVIILKVDSGGGYGDTWSDIKDVIFKVRENHRVIAWIESAISAAAMTVYCCDEMYYTSMGEVGSCTGYRGSPTNPLSPAGQQIMIHEMEKVLARSSRTPYLAACMFRLDKWLTYDKDPLTGEITYYDTVGGEGEYPLSTGNNITLTANQALKSGLCDGIANTEEELITLLQLENAEINLYGVELFDNWKKSFLEFQDTSQELYTIFQNGDPSADTEKKQITSQIKAGEKLLKWSKKLGEVARYSGLDEDRVKMLKRTILDLRRQLKNAPDE
jgi:membrane-bound ClpP family serine protease